MAGFISTVHSLLPEIEFVASPMSSRGISKAEAGSAFRRRRRPCAEWLGPVRCGPEGGFGQNQVHETFHPLADWRVML